MTTHAQTLTRWTAGLTYAADLVNTTLDEARAAKADARAAWDSLRETYGENLYTPETEPARRAANVAVSNARRLAGMVTRAISLGSGPEGHAFYLVTRGGEIVLADSFTHGDDTIDVVEVVRFHDGNAPTRRTIREDVEILDLVAAFDTEAQAVAYLDAADV